MLSVTNYMLQPQLNFRFGSSRKVSYGLRDGVLFCNKMKTTKIFSPGSSIGAGAITRLRAASSRFLGSVAGSAAIRVTGIRSLGTHFLHEIEIACFLAADWRLMMIADWLALHIPHLFSNLTMFNDKFRSPESIGYLLYIAENLSKKR